MEAHRASGLTKVTWLVTLAPIQGHYCGIVVAAPQALPQNYDHHLTSPPPTRKQDDGAAAQARCEMWAVTREEGVGRLASVDTEATGCRPPVTCYSESPAQEEPSDWLSPEALRHV